jgi:F0F1-type ATP synthase assembly protein I
VDLSSAVIAEILAGPVVWGGVGWLADRWLGTAPWLFVIGVMGGFVGGLYLVWLRLTRLRAADEARKASRHRTTDEQTEGEA